MSEHLVHTMVDRVRVRLPSCTFSCGFRSSMCTHEGFSCKSCDSWCCIDGIGVFALLSNDLLCGFVLCICMCLCLWSVVCVWMCFGVSGSFY